MAELLGPLFGPTFLALCADLTTVLGPLAPPRRRPKRIAKKLAKRGGRLRYFKVRRKPPRHSVLARSPVCAGYRADRRMAARRSQAQVMQRSRLSR